MVHVIVEDTVLHGHVIIEHALDGWTPRHLWTYFFRHTKELESYKVLLSDNLSSHFTNDVLLLCEEDVCKKTQ